MKALIVSADCAIVHQTNNYYFRRTICGNILDRKMRIFFSKTWHVSKTGEKSVQKNKIYKHSRPFLYTNTMSNRNLK